MCVQVLKAFGESDILVSSLSTAGRGFHFSFNVRGFHFSFAVRGFRFAFATRGFHLASAWRGFCVVDSLVGYLGDSIIAAWRRLILCFTGALVARGSGRGRWCQQRRGCRCCRR